MIKVVHGHEVALYRELMQRVFRLRYENFVVRKGWSLPHRDGLDIDQYDDLEAIYLVVLGSDNELLATARLNRTSRSSLLADLFPSLIETGEVPRAPTLWEGTRVTISASLPSKAAMRRARAELGCTAATLVQERGGTAIQAVVDYSAFPSFLEMSPRTRPLGLPRDYGGGVRSSGGGRCVAFKWDLSPELVADFEAYGRSEHLAPRSISVPESIQ